MSSPAIIIDGYSIARVDDFNWAIQRKSSGKKRSLQTLGYYPRLGLAAGALHEILLKKHSDSCKSLQELKAASEDIRDVLLGIASVPSDQSKKQTHTLGCVAPGFALTGRN